MEELKQYITTVDNFPNHGIKFYDVSPLLQHKLCTTISALAAQYTDEFWRGVDGIVGIDARGFIFASALAFYKQKSLFLVRKAGKLPPPLSSHSYSLEYGTDTLEMKSGTGNVLIVDDVLATGGTLYASAELCKKSGYTVQGFTTILNLTSLNDFSWNDLKAKAVLAYE